MKKYIDHDGKRYFYEYRLAKDGEICLGTTNPDMYCNGVYAYSRKDPGDGLAFVVTEIVAHESPAPRKEMSKQWINVEDRLPTEEGYYSVKYDDGSTDEKPFRIRPSKNIKGFMTLKKVIAWKTL